MLFPIPFLVAVSPVSGVEGSALVAVWGFGGGSGEWFTYSPVPGV